MESQPQNPEFRKNPENFHPCLQEGNNKGVGETVKIHRLVCTFVEGKKQTRWPITWSA